LPTTKSPLYKQPPTVGKKIRIGAVNAFALNACIEVYIISLAEWNRAVILECSRTKTTMKCEEKVLSQDVKRRDGYTN
jgi:hypothetical protein